MLTTAEFLRLVERHLELADVRASRFGKEVLGDPNFVGDLRKGRKPNLDSVNKVLEHISKADASQPEALVS